MKVRASGTEESTKSPNMAIPHLNGGAWISELNPVDGMKLFKRLERLFQTVCHSSKL